MPFAFALVTVVVLGLLIEPHLRATRRQHAAAGLFGAGEQNRLRAAQEANDLARAEAERGRRAGLQDLAAAFETLARRGLRIRGLDRVGGWVQVSFADGTAWLLRAAGPVPRLDVRRPVVVQAADFFGDGVGLEFYTVGVGAARLSVRDAIAWSPDQAPEEHHGAP
jgi:hypothetical protein